MVVYGNLVMVHFGHVLPPYHQYGRICVRHVAHLYMALLYSTNGLTVCRTDVTGAGALREKVRRTQSSRTNIESSLGISILGQGTRKMYQV